MYRILVADEFIAMQIGLKSLLAEAIEQPFIVDCSKTVDTFVDYLQDGQYDLVMVDLHMNGSNPMSMVRAILDNQSNPKIIALTKLERDHFFETCMGISEIKAFVCKHFTEAEIVMAIKHALNGKRYIPESLKDIAESILQNSPHYENPFEVLSTREQLVAKLLLKGLGILEIGNELAISSSTASTYKSRIFKKLHVNNVIDLNKFAAQYGFDIEALSPN